MTCFRLDINLTMLLRGIKQVHKLLIHYLENSPTKLYTNKDTYQEKKTFIEILKKCLSFRAKLALLQKVIGKLKTECT